MCNKCKSTNFVSKRTVRKSARAVSHGATHTVNARRLLAYVPIVALLCAASPAQSGVIEDVTFADEVHLNESADQRLRLYGMGLLRYRVIFRGYVAALYLPDGVSGDRALDDVPRKLELSYFWSIGAQDFASVANEFLEDTLPSKTFDQLRDRIDQMHRAYQDVAPEDRYALTYVPGTGTTLALNNVELVTVPGADFAKAYFGIWLGRRSLDDSLRDELLAGLK